jgi:hypothetical protein
MLTKPFQVSLVFEGVDVDNDETLDSLADFTEIEWSSRAGRLHITITQHGASAISVARLFVARFVRQLPTARLLGADRELVSINDVADRVGVHRETVRLWAEGTRGAGDFPPPAGVVGNRTKVWEWATVHRWLASHTGLGQSDIRQATLDDLARIDLLASGQAMMRMVFDATDRSCLELAFALNSSRWAISEPLNQPVQIALWGAQDVSTPGAGNQEPHAGHSLEVSADDQFALAG